MLKEAILGIALISNVNLTLIDVKVPSAVLISQKHVVAEHDLNLTSRLPDPSGAQIFADNILLALHYGKGDVKAIEESNNSMDWDKVRKPFEDSFVLKPGEVFAFHNNILPEFKGSVVYTLNSKFFMEEGYKALGGLGGNGVCHLASLINWVARDAGLEVVAKVNHDFYPVPGVPREYGTSIYYAENGSNSENQNLYVRNNLSIPVEFKFKADNKKVTLEVVEQLL